MTQYTCTMYQMHGQNEGCLSSNSKLFTPFEMQSETVANSKNNHLVKCFEHKIWSGLVSLVPLSGGVQYRVSESYTSFQSF